MVDLTLDDIDEIRYALNNLEIEVCAENFNIEDFAGSPYEGILGLQESGDIQYIGAQVGGDWEFPVYIALYKNRDNQLSIYLPTEGNAYNKIEKAAFGSYMSDAECCNYEPTEEEILYESIDIDNLPVEINKQLLKQQAIDHIIEHYEN